MFILWIRSEAVSLPFQYNPNEPLFTQRGKPVVSFGEYQWIENGPIKRRMDGQLKQHYKCRQCGRCTMTSRSRAYGRAFGKPPSSMEEIIAYFTPDHPLRLAKVYKLAAEDGVMEAEKFVQLVENVPNPDSADVWLIMFTDTDIKALCNCTHIHMDGTFKVVPSIYKEHATGKSQLFTIHSYAGGDYLIPRIFALMPRATEELYVLLFTRIRDYASTKGYAIHWRDITTDFEVALQQSIRRFFFVAPHNMIIVRGCFFHFCQCVYRHIQEDSTLLYLYYHNRSFEARFSAAKYQCSIIR
jgi:hypothetical protein